MRIGYVFVPLFPIAVERRRNPDLIDKPVILGGYPYERRPVFAASAECLEAGVKVGMPLRQAHLLCPEAVFLSVDFETYRSAFEELLVALDYFSPAVERDDLGAAHIDAEGLTLLFGEERELGRKIVEAIRRHLGMGARVAFGPGKFVAKVAAQLSPDAGVTVVKKGESGRVLFGLPIGRLGLGETSGERLRMLGIKTIGQFMRLPAQSLMEQLGPDAVAARRAIEDEGKDVVVPRATPSFLERSVALDYPIETMEGFSPLARDLIAFLVAQLRHRYLACQTVALHLELDDGRTAAASIQLKEPTDAEEDLRFVLERLVLRASRGDGGIVALRVALGGLVRPISRQMGFFDAQRRRRVHLDRALDEIKERFGERVQQGITLAQNATRTTHGRGAHQGG